MWYIPTGEYYSAEERDEVLIDITKWINLENMLSDRSQSTENHVLFM